MNRPLDKIHDPRWSYGRLILPWFGKWVGYFTQYGFKCTDANGFHNCRVTGVN